MKAKKQYQTANAEILRFDAKDIITLSGFFGAEVSFGNTKKTTEQATINWEDFGAN